ncbi:MAG: hypothetical protein KDA84_07035 [Planctomycetaceae bacterium]|nr:hypothetical protein [Planctomycetaceae bacterium]
MHERLALEEYSRGVLIKDISFVEGGVLIRGQTGNPFFGYWNIQTGQFGHETLEPVKFERILGFSNDGRFLILQKQGNRVQVWDRVIGKVAATFEHPTGQPPSHISNDGKTIVTSEGYKKLAVWDIPTGERHCKLKTGDGHCHLAPTGDFVVAGVVATVHDAHTGRKICSLPVDSSFATISPDGRSFVHAYHNRAKLFDLETGEKRESLVAPFELINGTVSPDNRRIAVGGCFQGVRVWDIPSEDIVATWDVPERYSRYLAFNADSSLLVSASDAGVVRLWDVAGNRELACLVLLNEIEWVTITPEGDFLGSNNASKYARWQMDGKKVDFDQYAKQFHSPKRVAASLKVG